MPELLYGGAAGGGKSDFLLGDWLQDVHVFGAAWQGVLFRRSYPELEELLKRSRELYPGTGAVWNEVRRCWTWPGGACLKLRYLGAERDAGRYQGHQYSWIGWDELTQWPTLGAYRLLRARLRSAHPVPVKRIRAAANPGGAGHAEVKRYFIDPAPGGGVITVDPDTGLERMFVPARLQDNRRLTEADPDYARRLKGLGSEALVRAWLDGDWSVVDGAFFDGWSARNIVAPFEIPRDWARFRSFDWGSAKPFSVGWWAVAGEWGEVEGPGGRVRLERGTLIRYREWYGANGPDKGLKLTAEQVAEGIRAREAAAGDRVFGGVADPSIFREDGGPSIGERMARAGVSWRPADNSRVARGGPGAGGGGALGGWDQMRARIAGDEDGPGLVVFSTCRDFIRTVPALQHDPARPEDVDTRSEDHAADECRYACMSRPMARRADDAAVRRARDYERWRPRGGAGYVL